MKLPDFVNQSDVNLKDRVSGFFGNEIKHDSLITNIEDIYKDVKALRDNVVVMEDGVEADATQVRMDAIDVRELSQRVFDSDRAVEAAKDEAIAAKDRAVQSETITVTAANSASSDAGKAKLSEELAMNYAHDARGFANNALLSSEESHKYFNYSYAIYEDLRKGQVYRGTWNPHTGAYPSGEGTNSAWDVILNEGEEEYTWDGKRWFWGDRLVYIKDTNIYQQIETGTGGGVTSVNGKKGAVTLTASEVGAVSTSGDTIKGPLFWHDNNKYINTSGSNMYVAAKTGRVYIEGESTPIARVQGVDYNIYHQGFKPTANDVGALPITGGYLSGKLTSNSLEADPLVLNRGAQVGVNFVYAPNTSKYLGVDITGDLRYGDNLNHSTNNKVYHEGFRPTAAGVGALPLEGGTMTGAINAAIRKSAIVVKDQASIRYQDANNAWFHNLPFGNSLRWSTGEDSAQTDLMVLHSNGNLSVSGLVDVQDAVYTKTGIISQNREGTGWLGLEAPEGAIPYISSKAPGQTNPRIAMRFPEAGPQVEGAMSVSGNLGIGGDFTSAGGIRSNSGYITAVKGINPMFELHKPGLGASIIYIDGSNHLRFSQSNGIAGEIAHYFSANTSGLTTPQKYTSTLNTNRAWTSVGHAGFYNDAGLSLGAGTYHGLASMYCGYPGVYTQETSLGYFSANTDWNQCSIILQSYNASTSAVTRWMFRNNGALEPSTGGWKVEGGGSMEGSVYGNTGGRYAYIHEWVQRNFAPLSDETFKRNIKPSVKSALSDVEKIKFHSYEWDEVAPVSDATKSTKIGIIAQEMEELDECYTRDIETFDEEGNVDTSIKALDVTNMLSLALKAIQELSEANKALTERVATLEAKNSV